MKTSDTYTEKIVYNYCLHNPKYFSVIKPILFEDAQIKRIFEHAKDFFQKYSEVPSREQLKHIVKMNSEEEELSFAIIDSIYDVKYDQYDDEWLDSTAQAWIRWRNLVIGMLNSFTFMKTADVNSDNIQNIADKVHGIVRDSVSIDFGDDNYLDFYDPVSHESDAYSAVPTGYQFIDDCTEGGFGAGTLNVFIGKAKVGKSVWLANIAANYMKSGRNVVLVTLELGQKKYLKRMTCNILNITGDNYKKLKDNTAELKRRLNFLESSGDGINPYGKFFIKEYPTSSASAPDIEAFVKNLEATKGVKIDVVLIDYINIMSNWRNPNSENTYMKIKHISEDTRAMMQRNNWIGVSLSQINRAEYDSSDMHMSSVSESMALIHTADSVFGIIQTELDHGENRYILKALALRDSEGINNMQEFTVDYSKMQIRQKL